MSSLKYVAPDAERMTFTLGSDYTAASGTMTATGGHGARLPSSGDFWIATTTGTYRAFKVTARSTDVLTVTAAQDGTSDGNLSTGQEMKWALTLSALDQLRQDLVQTGADSSKSAEKAASLYLPSDSQVLYRSTGSTFAPWGPIFPLTDPGLVSSWTWVNQGSATAVDTSGGIQVDSPIDASTDYRLLVKTSPGTPYKVDVLFLPTARWDQYNAWGVALRESGTGKFQVVTHVNAGAEGSYDIRVRKFTDPTTFSADYLNVASVDKPFLRFPVWLRIEDTGTNIVSSLCQDGLEGNFDQLHSISRTDFMAGGPDQYGFAFNTQNAARGVRARLLSLKVS